MFKSLLDNTRKPKNNIGGSIILKMMNFGHNSFAKWALSFINFGPMERILDIGCGGGKNIENMLARAKKAKVYGIDYSQASVAHSSSHNKKALKEGRAVILHAEVEKIPFESGFFDLATAFETVYFWPDLKENFKEAARTLKSGGIFMVCNEVSNKKDFERWAKIIKMNFYSAWDIKQYMEGAGLAKIEIHAHDNGKWLCVTGIKN